MAEECERKRKTGKRDIVRMINAIFAERRNKLRKLFAALSFHALLFELFAHSYFFFKFEIYVAVIVEGSAQIEINSDDSFGFRL